MNVQNYAYDVSQYVIVFGKTQIIHDMWKDFEMDINYIENNFKCFFIYMIKSNIRFFILKKKQKNV